jgi:hypothetical protein
MIDNPAPALPPYECSQIVYRAATGSDWIASDGRVKKQAFYPRRNHDPNGLSCAPTQADCRRHLQRPTHGTISLHVGRVRNLGLDVVPSDPTHANITGIPQREGNDRARATYLASKLAEIARSIPN